MTIHEDVKKRHEFTEMNPETEYRIPFDEILGVLEEKLLARDFTSEDAKLSARLFTEASCDGVYSHGINRFPLYVEFVDKGYIKVRSKPELISGNGVLEQWDGKLGPGNVNAFRSVERAVSLAREHGVGCVALSNTNHWMRGGTYGWKAADEGCLAIMWSNTTGNMPPWGGIKPSIGNNPLVMAVPRSAGHVVLDMSQSLFSFGKLTEFRDKGAQLPLEGGYNQEGNLTRDPAEILATMRPLPIGYWKGSGLSIMLDIFATILSGGKSTMELSRKEYEYGVSQVFIVIDPGSEVFHESREIVLDQILNEITNTPSANSNQPVRYPGERTAKIRSENLSQGIPVQEEVWKRIRYL